MTSHNTRSVNNASVNSTGLLFNVFKGLGLVDHKPIIELIDNCIDANSKNISITFKKINSKFKINHKTIPYNGYMLILSDDGIGMDRENQRIQKFLDICSPNSNNKKNGKYGVGAWSSILNITKDLHEKNKQSFIVYLSRTNDEGDISEICIPSLELYNRNIILDSIKDQNASSLNKKLWDEYKINDSNGTVLAITVSEDNIKMLTNNLKYFLMLHYNHFLYENKLAINFTHNNDKWSLSQKSKLFDFTERYNKDKNFVDFKIYIEKKYNKMVYLAELNQTNCKHDLEDKIIKIQQLNWAGHYPTCFELSNNSEIKGFTSGISIKINIISDRMSPKEFYRGYNLNANEYNGFFIVRNNKILCKPIELGGTRRADGWNNIIISIDYKDEFDNYIDTNVNKQAQLSEDNIDKGLARIIKLLVHAVKKHFCPSNSYEEGQKKKEITFKQKKQTIILKQIVRTKKLSVSSSDSESSSGSDSEDPDPNPINTNKKVKKLVPRKNFPKPTIRKLLDSNPYDNYFYIKNDTFSEIDHINGDRSNNSEENAQLLPPYVHRLKTRLSHDELKNMSEEEKVNIIIQQMNNLLESQYIKKALATGKVKFCDNTFLKIATDNKNVHC